MTGQTITALRGDQLALTAESTLSGYWPSGHPTWFKDDQPVITSPTITIDCNNVGTHVYKATCGTSSETVTVDIINPVLESINFEGGGVQDIYDIGSTPEWQRNPSRNVQYSVKKGQSFNVVATLSVPSPLTLPTSISVRLLANVSEEVLIFTQNTVFPSGGVLTPPTTTVSVTFQSSALNYVGLFSSDLNWQYTGLPNAIYTSLGTTSHIGYNTWDTKLCPPSDFTRDHISYACGNAQDATTLDQIGNKIGPNATAVARFGAWSSADLTEVWKLIDESDKTGDCRTLATLMKAAIALLGDNSSQVKYVLPRHSSWAGLVDGSFEYHPVRNTRLGFLAPGWNNYEGCCLFQNKWWMGGLGTSQNSAYQVLLHCTNPNTDISANKQVWSDDYSHAVSYPSGQP
jgi:hypothetical protein